MYKFVSYFFFNTTLSFLYKKYIVFFILFFFLFIFSYRVSAQDSVKVETIQVKDTIIVTKKGEAFIKKIKKYTERKSWTAKVASLFFVFRNDEVNSNEEQNSVASDKYKKYKNKIIRNIDIQVLNVLGYDVNNPNRKPSVWWESLGNKLHIKTQRFIIRDRLLFSQHQKVVPIKLSESERIIRQTNFIYDANISIVDIKNSDSVDVLVIAQDIWSLNGDLSGDISSASGYASIREINFLGSGSELRAALKIDPNFKRGWNWDGNFTINAIKETFITSNLYHYAEPNSEKWGASVNRDFLTSIFNKAGGANFYWEKNEITIVRDTIVRTIPFWSNHQDVWIGFATNFNKEETVEKHFTFSTRIIRDKYPDHLKTDILPFYESKLFFLGGVSYAKRKFYKDNYLFGLGRTEDVPTGFITSTVFGYQYKTTSKDLYMGIRSGHGTYHMKNGFFYQGVQVGSFYDITHSNWRNTLVSFDLLYFTRLHKIYKWRIRNFIWTRINFYFDNKIDPSILSLNNESGIRGFSSGDLRGNQKLAINYEFNLYPPVTLIGFRFVLLAFVDMGLLANPSTSLFKSKLYQGYGIGIRFRNEHLIFSAVQLYFGIYPGASGMDGQALNIYSRSSLFYRFNQFQFSSPAVLTFE